jgi:hypothetical protein
VSFEVTTTTTRSDVFASSMSDDESISSKNKASQKTLSNSRKRTIPAIYRDSILDASLPSSLYGSAKGLPHKKSCRRPKVDKQPSLEVVAVVDSSKISGSKIINFFNEKGLRYSAMPLAKDSETGQSLLKIWKENQIEFQYNFNSSEVKRMVRCIKHMRDDATDEYASSVEIKYVDKIMGYGVFANRRILRKEVIGVYSGIIDLNSSKEQKEEASKQGKDLSEYLFEFPDTPFQNYAIDGVQTGNFTRFINHTDPESANVSSVEFFYKGMCYVIYVSDKTILKGEQLFYDYGPTYWETKKSEPQ